MNFLKVGSLFCVLLIFSAVPAFGQATVGGYGELHFNKITNNVNGKGVPGQLDLHRVVLFTGYNFNDWISFRSELEVEHTLIENEDGEAEGGEVALEQAYINLQLKPALGIRAGLMLVPVGIVNPTHEPPSFNGVERPNVEKYLVPSTWRESGIGLFGRTQSGLSYKFYLMAGLKPNGIEGEEGIREARQAGFKSSTANFALTGRLDYQVNLNLKVGAAYYFSSLNSEIEDGTAEKIPALDDTNFNLVEGHLLYHRNRFEARGLLVYSGVSDVKALNNTFGNNAGKSQLGGYGELAYDILPSFASATVQQLFVFGRYESYDTQFKTAQIRDNRAFNRHEYTFGLTYKPAPRVAFKADYQLFKSAGDKDIEQFNMGVGYNF